ncbi:conserved hypothetical protein [Culex quinquefasciatus]|uniref:Uncharacterized protein n=1 Tax=Culex quinquefasciatus TaxID=7176 RepID=B0WDJ4_CULQU|nr:conserved hypothetical protein [Culex quinquefasciatus]|eukprot:XP_001846778.1 conserved hypothetical protein [Culex quinquefasciatus]
MYGFDQEAQICADWGDVDCEAATLYYGSDNFDLYRLGSGFESKRAPFAEEEEATFHLQRAETSDARRSKQFIVNQSSKPQQPPVHSNPNQIPPVQRPQQQQQLQQHHQQQHHHHRQSPVTTTTTTTTTSTTAAPFYSTTENYFNKASNLQYQKQIQQKHQQHKQQQLAYNQQQQIQQQQYRQLTAAAATATPADRSRQAEELRSTTPTSFPSNYQPTQRTSDNSNDEIFRGSHSSHFFNNRNNGKEDFDDDFVRRPAASTTSPTTTARPAAPSNTNATRSTQTRGRNRGRGSVRAHNLNIVRSEAKPPAARQQTRLQATTPEDFFDVPKIQNFSRGSANHHNNNNNNNNNFRQQPTTVLQPQTDNKINFGQQQQQNQQPASTPAPFSRGQRPTQNAATSRSSNAFFQQQQTNTTPARSIAQQYQTTTPAAQRFQQQQQQVNTTPRPQNFQQQQLVNTTPRPQNFQQFQTTTNVPLNQQRYQPPSTPAAANQHFTDFNNQFFAPNPSTTPPPNINYQFFSRNPSTPVPAQIINGNPTTQAPVQNFNRVTQSPQFYNTGFENKATERNEPITTPQEPQRTRAQSRSFNIDPARLNQFNYNEYQGSRTSTTTSTTTVAPTPAAAVFDFKPSTYNPLSYRQQQQPQQPLRQHPPSFNVNPFDPRSTAASVSITTTTTSTQRPASNNEQRYQTISRSASDNYTPSTIKKFSTLVPKDQYNPTTFKPNALSKKALLQFVIQKPEKQDKIIPPAPKIHEVTRAQRLVVGAHRRIDNAAEEDNT